MSTANSEQIPVANPDPQVRAFAGQLRDEFPHIADAISAGLACDLSGLLSVFQNDGDAAAGFQAVCATIEAYIVHVTNTLTAEKEELRVQAQTLGTNLQEKTNAIHSLVRTIEQLSTQNRPLVSSTTRRISKDPDPFSGAEKDVAKRQQQFVVWRSQLNSCFAQDSAVFNDEQQKILHIASLLTGDAYEFHRTDFDTITANPTAADNWHWKTAAEVFKSLSTQFETMDLAQQASQKFDNLYMLNKPFQNFVAEFQTLAQRCSKTKAQKVEALKKKVSKELADKLSYQPLPPPKDDFDSWCTLCQQLYNNEQEFKHFENLKPNRPAQFQAPQQYQRQPALTNTQEHGTLAMTLTPPPDIRGGNSMQLDSAHAAAKAAARAFCGANNLCFYCRKSGHMVAECNEKKSS